MEKETEMTHEEIWKEVIKCASDINNLIIERAKLLNFDEKNGWVFYSRSLNTVFRSHYGFVLKMSDQKIAEVSSNPQETV